MKIPSLSIVVPVYNEQVCLRKNIIAILHYAKQHIKEYEVIVVDDGSKDQTPVILNNFKNKVTVLRNEPNQGKGYSVKRGLLASTKPWALFMDADLSTPLDETKKLWRYHANHDVIFASRKAPGAKILYSQGGLRQCLGKIFPILVRTFLLGDFQDTQCGFKLFNRKAIRTIFPKQTIYRYGFDVEVLYLAKKKKLCIQEVPVTWINSTRSTLNPFKDSFKMLWELVKIRWNALRGKYG